MFSCALGMTMLQGANGEAVQIFGGYTVGKMKPENEANRTTMNGWNTSVTGYVTPRFGLTADVAGYYGNVTASAATGSSPETVKARQYSFMAGPQFKVLRSRRVETSLRVLAGGAYGYLPNYSEVNQTVFAALVGSNIDLKMTKRVAMRFSPGMYVTRFGTDQTQKNFRFSVGPVIEFGGAN
jgi:hypothetical protein